MNKNNKRRTYLLFLSIGILSFYISGFLLGILSETYGIGIYGLEAVSFMLFTYVILLAAGLIVSRERSFGFILKAFAISFATMFLISVAFFAWNAYTEVNIKWISFRDCKPRLINLLF
jgi:cell shape-determining protein MreD